MGSNGTGGALPVCKVCRLAGSHTTCLGGGVHTADGSPGSGVTGDAQGRAREERGKRENGGKRERVARKSDGTLREKQVRMEQEESEGTNSEGQWRQERRCSEDKERHQRRKS